jgi:hypothetical protein
MLPINYTTLKFGHLSRSSIFGNTKYQHQDSGIPNTHITWLILNHGSMTDERYPSIFNKLFGYFAYKLHLFKVDTIGSNIQCVEFPTLKH